MKTTRVVILGGGFAGLRAARSLGNRPGIEVKLVDRRNFHLFQPLLYQVAMAGLSPADIAAPIRSLLRSYANVQVLKSEVQGIDRERRVVRTDSGNLEYDYLIVATGMQTSYFGRDDWEASATGLKTIEDATTVRRRILDAFERAEVEADPEKIAARLTFIVVGGGPTGVELAGAIAEMARHALARDFRRIDPRTTRVILVEAGPRILPGFQEASSERATADLERLGVTVRTGARVTTLDEDGIRLGDAERIASRTVVWAAGVRATPAGEWLDTELDRTGRVRVEPDLSLPNDDRVFVAGDLAYLENDGKPLPGMAPVAMQQGRYLGQLIRGELAGRPRTPFRFLDKGQMATIGRSKAVLESGPVRMGGIFAWLGWVFVHIYYLSSFRNRFFVLLQWAWSYFRFGKGARLIVGEDPRDRDREASEDREPVTGSPISG